MAKPELKLKARELRKEGKSIKDIAKRLSVAQSTVSLWCREIELTQKQIEKLEKNSKDPYYGRRLLYVKKQQAERKKKTKCLLEEGIKEIGDLSQRDLFLVGVSLYWAEGFKKDTRVGFSNTDPKMIFLFIKWLDICCGCKKNDLNFRIAINEGHEHRKRDIENHWKKLIRFNDSQLQKTYIQKVKWKKSYKKPEKYFGVIRVRVRKSTDLLRKINGWIEGLRKNCLVEIASSVR